MEFAEKLGAYKLTGIALKNFKKMQCRPAYNRYKLRLKRFAKIKGFARVDPLPFDDFCDLQIAELKLMEQEKML